MPESTPPPTPAPSEPVRRSFFFESIERPIWSYRWFHVALGLAVVLMVCSFVLPPIINVLRLSQPVLVPVVIGLAIAYIFNPLITWLERRRIPRPASAVSILVLSAGSLLGLCLLMGPQVVREARAFSEHFPDRAATLAERMGVKAENLDPDLISIQHPGATAHPPEQAPPPPPPSLSPSTETPETEPAPSDNRMAIKHWIEVQVERLKHQPFNADSLPSQTVTALGYGWMVVTSVMSWAAYFIVAGIVTAMCFVVFSWHFNAVCAWPVPFIPVEYRTEVLRLTRACDKSIQAFIRGRLVQAAIFTIILSIGWFFCGVPYALLIGVTAGLLALLPYLAVITLPIAMGLLWIDMVGPDGSGLVWWKLAMPLVIYALAQILDGWVVEPLVQGKATGLSPLAVLLAVMLGAAIGGIVGIVLAIPTAACILILWREALLPRLKSLAESPERTA